MPLFGLDRKERAKFIELNSLALYNSLGLYNEVVQYWNRFSNRNPTEDIAGLKSLRSYHKKMIQLSM